MDNLQKISTINYIILFIRHTILCKIIRSTVPRLLHYLSKTLVRSPDLVDWLNCRCMQHEYETGGPVIVFDKCVGGKMYSAYK